ncbi:hypothetical protein SALBM311S_06707 [Streptomyces alboniger]
MLDTTAVEVPVKRAMIAASAQVVLLADAGKFPGTGMARVCGPRNWTWWSPTRPRTRRPVADCARRVSRWSKFLRLRGIRRSRCGCPSGANTREISSSEKPAVRPNAISARRSSTPGSYRRRRPRLPTEVISPFSS